MNVNVFGFFQIFRMSMQIHFLHLNFKEYNSLGFEDFCILVLIARLEQRQELDAKKQKADTIVSISHFDLFQYFLQTTETFHAINKLSIKVLMRMNMQKLPISR